MSSSPSGALPTGTLTFVFADLEGSTGLLERLGARYGEVLHGFHQLVRGAVAGHGGAVVDSEGDGMFCVFTDAAEAARAAIEIQRSLAGGEAACGIEGLEVRARLGLHTGRATVIAEGYVGIDVHRAARIGAAGHGGQILVSSTTRSLLLDVAETDEWTLRDLGRFSLKGLSRTDRLYQVSAPGLAGEFPPPQARSPDRVRLPAQLTSLVGRERATADVAALFDSGEARLVTLTGAGGIGKTRLALAVAERRRGEYPDGVYFVDLSSVTDADRVLARVAEAVAIPITGPVVDSVVEGLSDRRVLLLVDNFEQVAAGAPALVELLARSPGVHALVTSRVALRVGGEQEYLVAPLELPPDEAGDVASVTSSAAVQLFVARARAVRPAFDLSASTAADVAAIVRRLEGLPLAIELAAARTRLLDPHTLLGRLATSLDSVGEGPVDTPERQRTLRATVEWSVGLLDEAERSLLETMAVFVDGWTIDAAAEVAGLDDQRALELTEALVRHSLVRLDLAEFGPRVRMLGTIRQYMAERLAVRADAAEVERRHAEHYRTLAERADKPLRGTGQHEWVERLQAETGNLVAAVRWYLANDRRPLPHFISVLCTFWMMRDHPREVSSWIAELLPTADALDTTARTELLWAAAVIDNQVGNNAGALAAGERLEPLLDEIDDPFLRAVSLLALAWISPIVDDFDGALRHASASLELLRGQDEPFWTALAVGSLGFVEVVIGRHDEALAHLTEARQFGRFDEAWVAAGVEVQLGTVALAQDRLDDARAILDRALEFSLATSSPRNVSMSLVALARLAVAEADFERAALAMGAADGMHDRAGLRVWPSMRRAEEALFAQVREALGPGRFDELFAAGSKLNQREAAAAVGSHDHTNAETN